MIYALLMTAGILEFIFALLLVLEFFDMEAEKEAKYQDGYEEGLKDTLHKAIQCMERNAKAYNGELGIYDAINILRVAEESYNET